MRKVEQASLNVCVYAGRNEIENKYLYDLNMRVC